MADTEVDEKEPKPKASKKASSSEEEEETAASDEEALHTSDAEARVEGVAIADVSPDPQEGAKSSDSPAYEFPPGGDVDVATVPDDEIEGETPAPIQPDSRVILGYTDAVPDEVQGHPALIVNLYTVEDEDGEEVQTFDVKTRDEHDALVTGLTVEDVDEVIPGGVGVRGFGP